jgi:putative sigma-54 modulation protein
LKISISAKNGQLPDSVQDTIRKKIEKLPRFFDRTTGAVVLVDLADNDHPRVELKVTAEETADFFASDTAGNVLAALDSVVRKLERQLRKHKGKLTDHRGGRPQRNETMSND